MTRKPSKGKRLVGRDGDGRFCTHQHVEDDPDHTVMHQYDSNKKDPKDKDDTD
jgi:hypothetical protein